MAYTEQNSVANASEVVDRIAVFAGQNGWTVERNDVDGAARIATVRKAGVSDYVHLYTNGVDQHVFLRISTGYNAALPVEQQPGVSGESYTTLEGGPYPKVMLFASGDQVWAALSIARNAEYRHITFGVLEKAGAYVGGTYVGAAPWGQGGYYGNFTTGSSAPFFSGATPESGYVRANADGRNNASFPFVYGASADYAPTDAGPNNLVSEMAQRADDNAFSGRSIFHPITVYVGRTGSEIFFSPLGVVPDVRICSLKKFAPEQEVPIGSDTYVVFPAIARREEFSAFGDQPGASGMHGYAVRKVL